QHAKKMGLNPYVWFSNMEQIALRHIGREPVRYVANIHKYYLAYRQSEKTMERKSQEIKELQSR
ncbi:MAG: lytic transglycosylase F, partial [Nitrospirota bacterium]|nr:lytic transglycosylase F [Nitrospirota bacterium]